MNIIIKNVLVLGDIKKKYIDLLLETEGLNDLNDLNELSNLKTLKEYTEKGSTAIQKFDKNLVKEFDKNLTKINFNNYPLNKEQKIVEFFYSIIGFIENILDKRTKVGVGYAIVSTILINIFGKNEKNEKNEKNLEIEKVAKKALVKQKNYVITLTFGEVAENHVGMQQLGKIAREGQGFDLTDLELAKSQFEELGLECDIIDLVKEGKIEHIRPPPQPAYVLLVKGGIKALTSMDFDINDINIEVLKDSWDKKAFMKGRVVNKLARYNLNYADMSQEPDYENKKGRIVAFKDAPIVNTIRESLPKFFGEKAQNLFAEGNYYYDLKTTGIGFHGDAERRRVIAVRLGDSSIPLHYQWFQYSKPIGERIIISLEPGDVYAMSEVAVGTNWLKKIIPTLRHATGAKKYLEIKEK